MTMGKHVFCQKPLTHSVYESRLLTKLAASTGVATQMGNQGASDEGTDLVCEWIWNGEIGEVTKVLIPRIELGAMVMPAKAIAPVLRKSLLEMSDIISNFKGCIV